MNHLLNPGPSERRKRRPLGLAGIAALIALALPFAAHAGETHAKPALHKKANAARKAMPAPSLNSVSGLKTLIHSLEAREHDKDGDRDADKDKKPGAKQTRRLPSGRSVPFHAEEDGGGLDYLQALLYRTQQRAYPNDTIDLKAYWPAVQQRERMPAYQLNGPANGWTGNRASSASVPGVHSNALTRKWELVGPVNFTDHYQWGYGQGAITGRVNDVAYDPQNPGVYYLAAAGGGLWKSVDAGINWIPLGDNWPFLSAGSIAFEPGNSQVIYVGTGDYVGVGGRGFGVMKTTDGGATWTNLGFNEFGDKYISKVLVDPDNPQTVFVATGRVIRSKYIGGVDGGDVWVSTDGGQSWGLALPGTAAYGFSDMRFGAPDALGQRNLYAVGNNYNSDPKLNENLLYRSTDHGTTWNKLVFPGLTRTDPTMNGRPYSRIDLTTLATSPVDPDTVYLASGTDSVLFGSADAGDSWTSLGRPPAPTPGWGQSWYDQHLEASIRIVNKVPREYVYLSLFDIYSWSTLDSWKPVATAYQNTDQIHTDQHALSVNPNNPDEILAGNDGGIYRLVAPPSTDTWTATSLNANLFITQLYHVATHPTDATDVIAGAQDNGTPGSRGDTSIWSLLTGGDGADVAINQVNPNIQYGCYVYLLGLTLTTDNWVSSFKDITPDTGSDNVAFIAPFSLAPSAPNFLYAGTSYVYRYDQTTDTWVKRLGGKKLSPGAYLLDVRVAPSDSNRIYAGALDHKLWVSRDGGALWRDITGTLPDRAVRGIAISPTNPASVTVALSGIGSGVSHVWHCNDTSAVFPIWTDISGTGATALPDVPANTVVIDPNFPNHYFVGTDAGVFATINGGNTWSNANALGLPNVEVDELVIAPLTRYLTAATYGRSIWRLRLDDSKLTFSIAPKQVIGGSTTTITATITLTDPAQAGGTVFTLNSSNNALVTYPATVTVPAGQKTVTFPITTAAVATKTLITFTATSNRGTENASLTLLPTGNTIVSVTLSPTTVPGGALSNGTVTLDGPAPAGGTTVTLSSDDLNTATVPATVTVPAKSKTASFSVTTKRVPVTTTVTITATANASVSAKLTVRAVSLSALYLIPNFIRGANNGLAVITLGGTLDTPLVVTLTSSNPGAASVPATVTIPAGARSALFGIMGNQVTTPTTVTISGTANGVTVSAVLTLYP